MTYTPEDFMARNTILEYLKGLLEEDTPKNRQVVAEFLEEWEEENYAPFIGKIVKELKQKILTITKDQLEEMIKIIEEVDMENARNNSN